MRLEHIPLIIGAIVALIGLGFIADALMADSASPAHERRRRMRAERSRPGETIVGVGVLCIAAALIGRDTWRYGTVAVLAGSVMILVGVILNRTFLKEMLFFRGPARRGDGKEESQHENRSARLGGKASRPAAKSPAADRKSFAPPAKAPDATPATPRPPAAAPRPMASAAIETPVAPMRKLESSAPPPSVPKQSPARPEASPPSGPPERRKTPRGKK
jgi:hypothetical protein